MFENFPNNYVAYLTVLTIIAGYWLNFYKFPIMDEVSKTGKSYKIFPWSEKPQIAKSSPTWLIFHLAISLALLLVSGYNVIYPDWKNDHDNFVIFSVLHFAFTVLILINFTNLGDASPMMASIINLTPIIIMNAVYFSNWKYGNEIYFFTLASPVFIEGYKYLTQ